MTEFLVDSCVMLEILKIDESLLHLVGRIGRPVFAEVIRSEVPSLTNDIIDTYNIKIVEGDLEDFDRASLESRTGALSFQDIFCVLTAQRYGYTCLTMDKKLYEKCQALHVPVLRFCALLLRLVQEGVLGKSDARAYAEKSFQQNAWVSKNVLNDFLRKLNPLE